MSLTSDEFCMHYISYIFYGQNSISPCLSIKIFRSTVELIHNISYFIGLKLLTDILQGCGKTSLLDCICKESYDRDQVGFF